MGDLFVINLADSMRTKIQFLHLHLSLRARFLLLFIISACLTTFCETKHHQQRRMNNFVSINYLPNGEVETKVHYNGISAKETSVSSRNNSSLIYRELTDGRRFIQLVYENGTMKDCDFGRRKEQIESFLSVFQDSNRVDEDATKNVTVSTSNLVIEKLDKSKPLPKSVRKWFNYPKLRKLCKRKKREGKKKNVIRKKHKQDEDREFELNFDSRPKRDMVGDLLRIPGTHWCGKGYSANKYTQLGFFSKTDKCCRTHDLACPFWIGAMDTKFGLHNFRANTLMHCSCDERFRACLKMVGTRDADIVGKLFFNWVQTKCFVIKKKRLCVKWEGNKCIKKQIVKKAILKTNLSY